MHALHPRLAALALVVLVIVVIAVAVWWVRFRKK